MTGVVLEILGGIAGASNGNFLEGDAIGTAAPIGKCDVWFSVDGDNPFECLRSLLV